MFSSAASGEEGKEGDGGRGDSSDGRKRSFLVSVATGSAVAAIGGAYILYHNNYKLKAQENAVSHSHHKHSSIYIFEHTLILNTWILINDI